MSAHKNLLHTAVTAWLTAEGLEDTAENYERGVNTIMTVPGASSFSHDN